MTNLKALGRLGEGFAVNYLLELNYIIKKRNFVVRGGEIDIIAYDKSKKELVFFEVKTRKSEEWFALDQTLGEKQIYYLKRTACRYLFLNHLEDINWRIDHIAILTDGIKPIKLEHFESINDL